MTSPPVTPGSRRPRESLARQIVEFFACLLIAVCLFQYFEAQGYLISTGSMAPTLLGYHRRVECPSCRYKFAIGVTEGYDPRLATCPNCGQYDIDARAVPRNDGDQLLVNKALFDFRPPRRWEVVVFRNPQKPSEAYVKRIAGLPGETIEIRGGDVYADGKIQSKPLEAQRGVRVLVYDHDFRPPADDPEWRPRWQADGAWEADEGRFRIAAKKGEDESDVSWLTYRHWIRSGGQHQNDVVLEEWPRGVDFSDVASEALRYDFNRRRFGYRGAMSTEYRDRLLAKSDLPAFQAAVEELYEASHYAPITDRYSYNRPGAINGGSEPVRDVMLAVTLTGLSGGGELELVLDDGLAPYRFVLDPQRQQVRLEEPGKSSPLRTGPLPETIGRGPVLVEVSFMDRHLLCAIDGRLPFEPWEAAALPKLPPVTRLPIRIGARGVAVELSHLKVYRDVHYTLPDRLRREPFPQLTTEPEPEYFVLGDNSPVSVDSRYWPPDQGLIERSLIGKPFLVHLPAQTTQLEWRGWRGQVRIPDVSRIRYIR